ncbi:MAG: DUF2846 domain-containing protein, partial [Helicobacteraceae bacterium]|nr:DUF2846 domain-containing protein [Helicobacteraceae bacterium]
DQPLGKLGRNSYRRIELDAGGYIITSAGEKNAALRLLAEAGKTYYLRASHIIDLLNPRMELCVAEEKTAIAAIGAIKLTPTKKLPEIAPVTFSAEQKAKDADKDEEDEEETNAKPEDLINNPCPSKHPFLNN